METFSVQWGLMVDSFRMGLSKVGLIAVVRVGSRTMGLIVYIVLIGDEYHDFVFAG